MRQENLYFILFSLLIIVLNTNPAYSQGQTDSIQTKNMLGPVFIKNGENLKPKQLLEITKNIPEAYKEMKLAKTNNDVGTVFGAIGGGLVGFPLGTAIGGGKPNWTLAAIGAGLIVVSIPFSVAYAKHAKNAVNIYNSNLKQTGLRKINLKIGLANNGPCLKILF